MFLSFCISTPIRFVPGFVNSVYPDYNVRNEILHMMRDIRRIERKRDARESTGIKGVVTVVQTNERRLLSAVSFCGIFANAEIPNFRNFPLYFSILILSSFIDHHSHTHYRYYCMT